MILVRVGVRITPFRWSINFSARETMLASFGRAGVPSKDLLAQRRRWQSASCRLDGGQGDSRKRRKGSKGVEETQHSSRRRSFSSSASPFMDSNAGMALSYPEAGKRASPRRRKNTLGFTLEGTDRAVLYASLRQYRARWQRRRDAFSAISSCLQIFRFTSSKPSKSAIASDEKFIRLRTNSFVRYCQKSQEAGRKLCTVGKLLLNA